MTAVDLRGSVEALAGSSTPSFLARYRRRSGRDAPALELLQGLDAGAASLASDSEATVVFAGRLFDRTRLRERFRPAAPDGTDAELVLAAYASLGAPALAELRGVFGLALADRRSEQLLFARDQLGHYPLFYAEGADGLYLSETITTLVRHPAVPGDVNRAAVAEMLLHRPRSPDETAFQAVYRVRAGWRYEVTAAGTIAERYWFPVAPDAEPVREDELERFDELMEQAVARTLEPGATGIFLSGGLDSVTVATFAADVLRDAGEPPPLAFSLAFPGFDETAVQTLVARELGLPIELVPFEEAAGEESLVASAVRASGSWPMPLVNLWQPLYTHLALLAREKGVRTILTGAGGDEWLQVSPEWGFSALRRLHLGEMRHLYRTYLRSYNLKRGPLLKNLLWRYGIYSTLRSAGLSALSALSPRATAALKRRRFAERKPAWLAPDPALAAELARRAETVGSLENPAVRFVGESRPFFENPIGAMEREEAFERGRRLGMETYMPFWDVDLAEFLARVPPQLLNQDHWSKGLLRRKLAARFPAAGFDRQKKILSTSLSTRLLADQSPTAWKTMGGISSLANAGIIDAESLESDVEGRLEGLVRHDKDERRGVLERAIAAHGIWTVLNVESWLRQWE